MRLGDGVGRQPPFVIWVQAHKSGDKVAPALTYSQNKLKLRNKRTGWSQPGWHPILQELPVRPRPSSPASFPAHYHHPPEPTAPAGREIPPKPPPEVTQGEREGDGVPGLLGVLSGEPSGVLASLSCGEGAREAPCSGQGPSVGAGDGRRSWSQAHGPSCQSER